jgi:Ca-activated chloride channel family protein
MSFESPWWLLALLAVPAALGLFLLLRRRGPRFAVPFPNVEVLAQVRSPRDSWRTAVALALAVLSAAALAVAVARPHMTMRVPDEQAMVILVVDTSRSMLSEDVRPSRLEAAKAAAQRFLDRVPDRLRVGVVTFSGDAHVTALPTKDHERVRRSVAAIDAFASFGGGTAIGDALARAVEVGHEALAGDGEIPGGRAAVAPADREGLVSILFLSDGRQNRGILPPLEGARLAREAAFPVYTVALGTGGGSATGGGFGSGGFGGRARAPDPATLRAIAEATGGEFTEARTAESVSAAYESLGSRLGRVARRTEVTVAFVAAGAVALLAAALAGAWWSPRLP